MRRALCSALVALACAAGLTTACAASDLSQQVNAYRAAHEAAILGELATLARLPSVAAHPAGLVAAANRLQGELKQRGFETAQLTAQGGSPPVVFGLYEVPGAKRTVVFYAHYDGQPGSRSHGRG